VSRVCARHYLEDKGIRSFACDLPGFGRSDGDRNLAMAPEKTRAFILGEMIRLCGTVRPVIVSPTTSGAYSMPFLMYRTEEVGGFLVDGTVSVWGSDGAHTLRDTEKMIGFIKSKIAKLPEKGIEIPVKVMIGGKAKETALSGLWRDFANAFPVAEVVDVPGHIRAEVYDSMPREFNEQIVRLCALAMVRTQPGGPGFRGSGAL
jgi:hypothetical protein